MKILIVYYSRYGHVLQLARAVEAGAKTVEGIEVVFRRAPEFPEVLKELEKSEHASRIWKEQQATPECSLDDLREASGVVFGSPTRFGNMIAQMKYLFDSTASLWLKGEMEGKPAGLFTSTASTHGGQETTCLTMMAPLLHLGMLVVGVPYSIPGMIHVEARGGTPYGASTIAGAKAELSPAPADLEIARALGRRVSMITKKLFS
ncbi:MAG: NAD(P)H:quinone oxidoreductase [Candidatus Omnitrophica bacterium]|nr:NAD(P)H:quinone oxidoreductase [Candidatus Omnitrophota bacterium]